MSAPHSVSAAPAFSGGGVAGELLRATDWSTLELGPVEGWPTSLRTVVRMMLSTRQATAVFWGPGLVNLYNDSFITLLGEKHPRAMGQRAEECWSDAWPVVGGLLADVMAHGRAVLFEEMRVPIVRNGTLQDAWWNYSYSPVFDDDGAIAGVLVVATETTREVANRTQLEAAKREAEVARTELHSILMQAPLAIALVKGKDHRFTLANGPYRDLVARDVIGKTLDEAFTEEEVIFYRPSLDAVLETGEPGGLLEAPLRLPGPDGVIVDRFLDVNYHPYRDANGTISGVLATAYDVTPSVLARTREAKLRETAESASRAKDEFLATVSHELRNPLHSILGWARILADGHESPRVEKGVGVILRNAVAQAKLIEDILDVSRIVAGKVVITPRRVRLETIIRNAIESALPAATAKQIRLEVSLEQADVAFVADEDRLQQIVWNLLSNAVKFTPTGGEVRVTATRQAATVAIRVEDSGKGIASALLPFVFDRFRQGDATTTKQYGGLGLGLAIVRHLVELHGGTVSAESAGEGRGACFELILPIRAVEPREQDSSVPVPTVSARSIEALEPASLDGIHVLVVDDEPDARELVATVLGEAGAKVTVAASAREAFAALASGSFDVVVSDIGMPVEDGYSLVARIRSEASAEIRDVPALALTAYARAEDRARARRAGFQDHIAKPVDADALVRTVATLGRARTAEFGVL